MGKGSRMSTIISKKSHRVEMIIRLRKTKEIEFENRGTYFCVLSQRRVVYFRYTRGRKRIRFAPAKSNTEGRIA